MEILRGHTPNIVYKEFWAHLMVYNLIRGVMGTAAKAGSVSICRLSLKGARQRLLVTIPLLDHAYPKRQQKLLSYLIQSIASDIVPDRQDRVEPRARKRRPKSYKLLTLPRHVVRRRLAG